MGDKGKREVIERWVQYFYEHLNDAENVATEDKVCKVTLRSSPYGDFSRNIIQK